MSFPPSCAIVSPMFRADPTTVLRLANGAVIKDGYLRLKVICEAYGVDYVARLDGIDPIRRFSRTYLRASKYIWSKTRTKIRTDTGGRRPIRIGNWYKLPFPNGIYECRRYVPFGRRTYNICADRVFFEFSHGIFTLIDWREAKKRVSDRTGTPIPPRMMSIPPDRYFVLMQAAKLGRKDIVERMLKRYRLEDPV